MYTFFIKMVERVITHRSVLEWAEPAYAVHFHWGANAGEITHIQVYLI
jgi:hypothetical protein